MIATQDIISLYGHSEIKYNKLYYMSCNIINPLNIQDIQKPEYVKFGNEEYEFMIYYDDTLYDISFAQLEYIMGGGCSLELASNVIIGLRRMSKRYD